MLDRGCFSTAIERQKLVLLPKGNGPPNEPSSNRPILLLDTKGKILERIISTTDCYQLSKKMEGYQNSNMGSGKKNQRWAQLIWLFNYPKKKEATEGKIWKGGTKQYCATVTLDVKNTFNTANWNRILDSLPLYRLHIPQYLIQIICDYFNDRTMVYDTVEGQKQYKVSGGIPQGSVLGPLLWNIMYDSILRLSLPEGVHIVGFADDIAVVVTAKHLTEVELSANVVIERIKQWLENAGLSLAEHKTDAVLISSRKVKELINIQVEQHTIVSKLAIKYLGVMINERLKFKSNIEYACMHESG